MRSTFIITLVLLVAAFAVAQDTTSPSAPAGQSQTQAPAPKSPSMGGDIVEGCLGGSNPNYTITDKAGTVYQLQIPAGADASSLEKHVGEPVAVQGSVDKSASKSDMPADSSASKSAAGAKSIQVAKIGKGMGTCPAASSTPKPPSK